MKGSTINNYRTGSPFVFGILLLCLLFSSSFDTLSQIEVFSHKNECPFHCKTDLTANTIESEKEIADDASNLFIIESKKAKFIENIPNLFFSNLLTLVNSPSYDIKLPPPKTLFS